MPYKNKEDQNAASRRYYQKHKKEHIIRCRNWDKLHPDKVKEYAKRYEEKYPHIRTIQTRKYYQRIKMEIIELLGGKCVRCGMDDLRCLQRDHVKGGGCKEQREMGRRFYERHILEQIKNGSKEYQLLCANCNWIKRYENKEAPQPSY